MLTDERIQELSGQSLDASYQFGRLWIDGVEEFARAIEAEVRKDDESLIRQMKEALTAPCAGEELLALKQAAITAATARLEKAP
jgi:hypothetical protein